MNLRGKYMNVFQYHVLLEYIIYMQLPMFMYSYGCS